MIQFVHLGETSFSVYQAGQGAPLLFVHGFPLDHQMWEVQLDDLQQGYRVIAPDLRGFGQSRGVQDVITMQQYADDLAELLEQMEIDEPVTFCGLSMGGYIAWQFALRHPQKLARLVLCDTRALPDDEAGQKKRRDLSEEVLNHGTLSLSEQMPGKLFSPLTKQSAPEVVEKIRAVIRRTSPQAISAASLGMSLRPDITPRLGEFDLPALVVCGTDDEIVSVEEMKSMAQSMPHARFAEIPGAGHMSPLEKPQVFNSLLREFLGSTDV